MKKLLLFLMINSCLGLYAQGSFEFSKTDSSSLSKADIYTKTKMFISDTWKSSKSVIENDDKEGGVIQIKSFIIKEFKMDAFGTGHYYKYVYSVKFRIKDNKFNIKIYDLRCVEAKNAKYVGDTDAPLIQPFDGEPIEKTSNLWGGISKSKAIDMMSYLKNNMNYIIQEYSKYMLKKDDSF